MASKTDVRIEHIITAGTFSLDGDTFELENNVWFVGNDEEVVVFDAPHDVEKILAQVADRKVKAILCTHAHDDHIRYAPELREKTGAPIYLHPDAKPLWEMAHGDLKWDHDINEGDVFDIAGLELSVIHTPGHSPGGVCYYAKDLGVVFGGDTLFNGGPGATGRSYSCHKTIVESIRTKLFALPKDTVVHTGHGESTTIGAEEDNVPLVG